MQDGWTIHLARLSILKISNYSKLLMQRKHK